METKKITSQRLRNELLRVDQDGAEQIILETVKSQSPIKIAGNLISDTLKQIGDDWEKGEVSLSQVYMSGIICERIIDKILPPQSPVRKHQPKTAIAVFEDYHLLGKRIIYSTLRAGGIELMDLGGGLTVEQLVNMVKAEKIKILLISVLMLPSALRIKNLKEHLSDTDTIIVVGGAPFRFDENLWKDIGVDYFGKDSAEALDIVNKLIEESV